MAGRHHGPTWHNDEAQMNGSLDRQIRRWSYLAIMRQRDINRPDIAKALGITAARVDQMIQAMQEQHQMALDQAITIITDERGGVQEAIVSALPEPTGSTRQPPKDGLTGVSGAHNGKGLARKYEGTPFRPHPNSLAETFKGERKREYERWLSRIKGDAA